MPLAPAARILILARLAFAASVLVAAPGLARATVIFSDFGPNGTYANGTDFSILGDGAPRYTPEFLFTAMANVTLNQIDVPLSNQDGFGAVGRSTREE